MKIKCHVAYRTREGKNYIKSDRGTVDLPADEFFRTLPKNVTI
jgi:hypothetical protein